MLFVADVPHLQLRMTHSESEGSLTLLADLLSKDDLMYAEDYREKYYSGATQQWRQHLISSPVTEALLPCTSFQARVISSPVHVHIAAKDGEEAVELVQRGVENLVETWYVFTQAL